jgi:hypothetical protein
MQRGTSVNDEQSDINVKNKFKCKLQHMFDKVVIFTLITEGLTIIYIYIYIESIQLTNWTVIAQLV